VPFCPVIVCILYSLRLLYCFNERIHDDDDDNDVDDNVCGCFFTFREIGCYTCLLIERRHTNVLQYKESEILLILIVFTLVTAYVTFTVNVFANIYFGSVHIVTARGTARFGMRQYAEIDLVLKKADCGLLRTCCPQ